MADRFKQEDLARLMRATPNVRNLCIIAHVDHGKTTMADSLLASNGIISERLSGKMRYMDSRDDEQRRGITMKSSGVTLLHKTDGVPHIINLIDSPGHVDFSSEVSTAARLSDGAVVLVDVVEGVSAQTHAVLRQAWSESITPCLVLNKIDRLIVELKLTPLEAYDHIHRVLEQVNLITAHLFTGKMIAKLDELASKEQQDNHAADGTEQRVESTDPEDDDSELYFEPQKGNVVFASALDGWGCTVFDFAEIVAKKMGCPADALKKCLWGDYYLAKEKGSVKVKKGAQAKGKTPLFVTFVLTPIWKLYEAALPESGQLSKLDKDNIVKMAGAVGVKLTARDTQADPKTLLTTVMARWIPLSRSVLDVICRFLPSPRAIAPNRVNTLLFSTPQPSQHQLKEFASCVSAMEACEPSENGDEQVLAFVSKMVTVEKKSFPEHQRRSLTAEQMRAKRAAYLSQMNRSSNSAKSAKSAEADDMAAHIISADQHIQMHLDDDEADGHDGTQESDTSSSANDEDFAFVAYTRVFAGTLRPGQKIHVLGARYDPNHPEKHREEVEIENIYLFMGRTLLPVLEAPAGAIVGITGLAGSVLKTATLSSTPSCPRFRGLYENAKPIVRVALETTKIAQLADLQAGLEKLNRADPCVEVIVQETGEYVLAAAGEVHIERCVTDLREMYCPGVSFTVSPPIVPYRETLVPPPTVDVTNESIGAENAAGKRKCYLKMEDLKEDDSGAVTLSTSSEAFTLTVRASPLPSALTDFLQKHPSPLHRVTLAFSEKMKRRAKRQRTRSSRRQRNLSQTKSLQVPNDGSGTLQDEAPETQGELEGLPKRTAMTEDLDLARGTASDDNADDDMNDSDDDDDNDDDDAGRDNDEENGAGDDHDEMTPDELCTALTAVIGRAKEESNAPLAWHGEAASILAFGSKQRGPNILSISPHLGLPTLFKDAKADGNPLLACLPSLMVAFQFATQSGPLCEEPMIGVAFEVIDIAVAAPEGQGEGERDAATAKLPKGFAGNVITTSRDAFRQAFLCQHVRLMTAMFSCELLVSGSSLGKVHGVLSKRDARISNEEMKEGTDSFLIECLLPATNIYGFAKELRKKTSGLAAPQLMFSHWEVVGEDPFWVPTTEEELALFGEKGDAPNLARQLMDEARSRKGLWVEKKIVEHGEKQRTISKKK